MKRILLSVLVTLLVLSLFFTSFVLGAMDGCEDAGFDTFAVGVDGIFCINKTSFKQIAPPSYIIGDL